MLLFGKMTLEYAWGMRRRISPCSVILPSISYGRTRLPNWGFKTNASKLAGMIPTWLRLCLGKSFNAIALETPASLPIPVQGRDSSIFLCSDPDFERNLPGTACLLRYHCHQMGTRTYALQNDCRDVSG